jgi:hypothetical protein
MCLPSSNARRNAVLCLTLVLFLGIFYGHWKPIVSLPVLFQTQTGLRTDLANVLSRFTSVQSLLLCSLIAVVSLWRSAKK